MYNFLYIADTGNHCIRKVNLDTGEIKEYVGLCEEPGFKDGPHIINRLNTPELIGLDEDGFLYIFD